MENTQTVTGQDEEERIAKLEKANAGLIRDLTETRKEKRSLEERISLIETSLSAPEPTPLQPVDVRIQRFTEDPDAYIREVVKPVIREEVDPLKRGLSNSQINRQIDDAMENIAEKEGITRRQAVSKYEKRLAEISEERDLVKLEPIKGIMTAYQIMKTEEEESASREKKREAAISGQHTETVRSNGKGGPKVWTTSEISKMSRGPGGEFDQNKDAILQAQREGKIVRDN